MGQRLVINIEKNEKVIAAIYYHWSAYTSSALYETKKVIDCIYDHKNETQEEMLLRLIKHLEKNGGGIRGADKEFDYIKALYPNEQFKTENYSRNDGLIALSKDGISALQSWSEGDVFINLDEDRVDFCVYSGYENLDEYLEERKEWDDEFDEEKFKNIPKLDCCLGHFDVGEIDYVMAQLDSVGNCGVVQCDDEICELID